MALTDLASVFGELFRAQKGASANTSAQLTLTTAYQDLVFSGNAGLNAGAAPNAAFVGVWTPGATATSVTLRALVSLDGGTTYAAPPTIPSPTDGTNTAYQSEIVFNKANWGNVDTAMNIACILDAVKGYRTFKIQAKSDSASGSPTLVLQTASGTGE